MRSWILYGVNGQAEQLTDWNQVNWVKVHNRLKGRRGSDRWVLDADINGEDIETHHIVPVKDGGSDDAENLIHLHSACHKQEHNNTKLKA